MTAGSGADNLSELPPELTSRGQRERLLAGALEVVVTRGYPGTSVAHIIAAAGVSRKTFYECFANKEACVLAAYDSIVDWLGERIAQAVSGIEDWAQGVRIAVKAALSCLAADLRLARFCAVDILHLGRVGFARYEDSVERLVVPLRAGRARCPWGTGLPLSLEQTVLGGAVWLIGHRARLNDPTSVTALAPDITYFLLAPYLYIPVAHRTAAAH
jgi:AcrR family transcriptional regulator